MKKIIFWLFAIAAFCIALSLAAILVLPHIINFEKYRPQIETKVSQAVGRPFTLGDNFKISIFPWTGVSFTNLKMGNQQTSSEFSGKDFIRVKSFEARIRLLPLLQKKVEIKKFILIGPEITLIKERERNNWTFSHSKIDEKTATNQPNQVSAQTVKKQGAFPLQSLQVDEWSIKEGKIIFEDRNTGTIKTIDELTLDLQDISLTTPIAVTFTARIDGQPVALTGTIGPLATQGQKVGRAPLAFSLQLKAFKDIAVNIEGNIADPLLQQKFSVHLQTQPFSPRALMQQLNLPLPVTTADKSVLNRMAVTLTAEGTPQKLTIKDSSLLLDDSTMTFSGAFIPGKTPDITYSLAIDSLTLDRYLPLPEEPEKKGTAPEKPASPLPEKTTAGQDTVSKDGTEIASTTYEPLRKLKIQGMLSIDKLVVHNASIENLMLPLTAEHGIFTINPVTMDLYKGKLTGQASLDVQENIPHGSAVLSSQDVQIEPFLHDTLGKDIIEGSMNIDTTISFSGSTADGIKKSLTGKGMLYFHDGALLGVDIAGMAGNLKNTITGSAQQTSTARTDFSEFKIPFTLTNGLFKTTDTSLISPLLRVKAAGTADMVSEVLDMQVQPKLVGTLKGQGDTRSRSGLTIPLKVTGTFQKPEIALDATGTTGKELLKNAINDPKQTQEKVKQLQKTGKGILQGFGIGK